MTTRTLIINVASNYVEKGGAMLVSSLIMPYLFLGRPTGSETGWVTLVNVNAIANNASDLLVPLWLFATLLKKM